VPVSPTYPGVYVNELPNPVRPIVGVPTSVTAFVGTAPQGQTETPVVCSSFSDYESNFGSLDPSVPLSYAVYMYFLNGGSQALVVRTGADGEPTYQAKLSADVILDATSPGAWGAGLSAEVDDANVIPNTPAQFNLSISLNGVVVENYAGVSLQSGGPTYIGTLLGSSQYVTLDPSSAPATVPPAATYPFAEVPAAPASGAAATPASGAAATPASGAAATPASGAAAAPASGAAATPASGAATPPPPPVPLGDPNAKTGIYALLKADIFNILCLPCDPTNTWDKSEILSPAIEFCKQQRAMLIVDPPAAWSNHAGPLDFGTVVNTSPALSVNSENAAIYYPNLGVTDFSGANLMIGPCGAIAGLWAQTDVQRGVWKAPAGTAASINGVASLAAHIDDGESGVLNPIAVNALRTMPEVGPVIWGARTSLGADQVASQWKYVPVRRTALFIEESLRRGTQWVVFEPNDEPLWASIRLNVGSFMQGLFRQGAFQGATASDAYLVQCDSSNNPQSSIDLGIVNILVGFAPLKPAEFVIINIQQQAGQS
jgi:uncharacterized protein